MFTRTLGKSDLTVSALGLGCWAIGGPFWRGDTPVGWGDVDDDQSIRAVQRALDLGVNFFDTADVYGCGHSERILGRALAGQRDNVVIATKFGNTFDEQTRQITGFSGDPAYIEQACEASLRRLNIDTIDLYQFHIGDYDLEKADAVQETLERLVDAGKIRWYGWSTDDPTRAAFFTQGEHYVSVQQRFNLFEGSTETLTVCEEHGLASINRSPLAKGLLTGKFHVNSTLPPNDVRHDWDFRRGEPARRLQTLEALRNVMTRDGRSPAQAALGWLWARSERTIPIPGFKNIAQVEENVDALKYGPLDAEQMDAVADLLS